MTTVAMYALAAQRHMYEFGTTSEQLAEIKVAASLHAQHNPNAFFASRCHRGGSARFADGSASPCTGSTAASSPTAAARSWWSAQRSPGPPATVREGPRPRRGAQARRRTVASTSPTRAPSVRPRAFDEAGVTPDRTSTTPRSTTRSPSRCWRPSRISASARRARGAVRARRGAESPRWAGCPSTPTAAACATTIRATGAA